MKEHYEAVLKDMESQEARLEAQLAKIRAARPAILALMDDAAPKPLQAPSLFAPPKYAAMGPKEAVLDLLAGAPHPLETIEIELELKKGSVKSNSNDFPSVVKSTLANLKKDGVVERLEDGWRLKVRSRPVAVIPLNQDGPTFLANASQQPS
jgi:hypothetical protein